MTEKEWDAINKGLNEVDKLSQKRYMEVLALVKAQRTELEFIKKQANSTIDNSMRYALIYCGSIIALTLIAIKFLIL